MSTEAPREKTTATKTTEAAKKIRNIVKGMNLKAHEAREQGKPIAYAFVSSSHYEILRVMDITPVWTENYAGLCAAKMDADRFISKAEVDGYSRHLCSYATCGLGFDVLRTELGEMPPNAPDGGMESPTMMIGTGMMICDPRYKWYQAAQRYNNAPMHVIGLLSPPFDANLDEVQDYYIDYTEEELREFVGFLEKQTGKKMDWDRLDETIDLSNKADRIWWEAYQLRKTIPTPMSIEDALNIMVPSRFLLGTQQGLDFYQELYDELKYRVDHKMGVTGVMPEEKYRIAWGMGLPPWFALNIFDYFKKLGAVFPIENCYRPPDPVDVPKGLHPLRKLAWKFFNQSTYWYKKAQRNSGHPDVERLLEWIKDYNIDGVVMHCAMTCRTVHCGEIDQLNILKEHIDIPTVILESDMADAHNFSEAQFKARIDAFMEIIADYKKKGV